MSQYSRSRELLGHRLAVLPGGTAAANCLCYLTDYQCWELLQTGLSGDRSWEAIAALVMLTASCVLSLAEWQ